VNISCFFSFLFGLRNLRGKGARGTTRIIPGRLVAIVD